MLMKRKMIVIPAAAVLCMAAGFLFCRSITAKTAASVTGNMRSESYVGGVIYQESAEVAALYKQTFELARLQLDRQIAENAEGKTLAIVTDIDATLIDDSGYFAGALTDAEGRRKQGRTPWNNEDWCGYYTSAASESSKAVPGAAEFIQYARQQGVQIYFITNRPYYELDLTVRQLYREGFIDEDTLNAYAGLEADGGALQTRYTDGEQLQAFMQKVNEGTDFEMGDGYFTLKGDCTVQVQGASFSSDKAQRRHNVAEQLGENGKVVLYLGDSLNDMVSPDEYRYTDYSESESAQFSRERGSEARSEAVMNERWRDKWGTQFIVMPNSAYGDWQKATWFRKNVDEQGEADAIREQFSRHSYLNAEIWYDGVSPIDHGTE